MKRIRCFFIRRKLVEYRYGEIAAEKRELVKSHIDVCPGCKRILKEIESIPIATEKAHKLEIPDGLLELLSQKVIIRISEHNVLKQRYRKLQLKKALIFASCIIFLGIILHTTKFYLIEKEIGHSPEFYQNLELLWNLNLINAMIEDDSFVSSIFNKGIEEPNIIHNSKRKLHLIVHHFKNLPDFEKSLILANYQEWINTPPSQKELHQKVYHYLKKINHPELKRITCK